jgi:hypothetical protein
MDEVHDDRHRHVSSHGLLAEQVDLGLVAIDQRSSNSSAMTASGGWARLAQTRLCSGAGRAGAVAGFPAGGKISSGVRTNGAIVYTAATAAMRLACRRRPRPSRAVKVVARVAAAFCVASRKSSGRITTPLPSTVSTRIGPVAGAALACA